MGTAAKAEYNRGLKQSREQIKVLQEKWPAGFPIVPSKVRPPPNGPRAEAPLERASARGIPRSHNRPHCRSRRARSRAKRSMKENP